MKDDGARQSQVQAEFSSLEKAIGALSDVVGRSEERLGRVLRSEPSSPEGIGSPEQELVPLAQSLSESRHRVAAQTGRLEDILSRLEL